MDLKGRNLKLLFSSHVPKQYDFILSVDTKMMGMLFRFQVVS